MISVTKKRILERDKEDERKARRRSRSYAEHFLRDLPAMLRKAWQAGPTKPCTIWCRAKSQPKRRFCSRISFCYALLIQPPIRDLYRTRFREYPLGILCLAAALRKSGFSVSIIDARQCRKPHSVEPYPELAYLEKLYSGSGLFSGFRHFGMTYESIGAAVAGFAPDVVCISSMFTPYEREVFETARAVKKSCPSARIIVGGCHATADPWSHLKHGYIDAVVSGEAEETLPEIIGRCQDGPVASDRDGRPFMIDDLDSLAHPARDLINPDNYLYGRRRYAMVVTSRGCPHRCSFCSAHVVAGRRFRKRSVDSVIDEMRECIVKYGIRVIDFQDDNLLFDRERAFTLLESISKNFGGYDIELLASNGLNIAHLDRGILELMKRCGFKKLDLAIGTGDVPSRGHLLRPENIGQYEAVLAAALEIGFKATTYIIVGMPAQSIKEMNETITYLMKKDTLIAPSIFYNVPGMPVFDEMKQFEYISDNVARRGTAINCFGEDFGRGDILEFVKKIRNHNLCKRQNYL